MFLPGCSCLLLLGDPPDDGLAAVAPVAAELDVREETGASVLADPSFRDVEQLCDFARIEEAIVHAASRFGRRARAAALTPSPVARSERGSSENASAPRLRNE
jgi:hypothetical protein